MSRKQEIEKAERKGGSYNSSYTVIGRYLLSLCSVIVLMLLKLLNPGTTSWVRSRFPRWDLGGIAVGIGLGVGADYRSYGGGYGSHSVWLGPKA